ncbi:MAG: UDP-N-acetylmuramoyl-L-alanine--D-glutamate ligase [Gemmatimonadota bacterium]|nr:UDP-N-acetylmuramoyl-L-alanine--D-glutamate ligase [Gemmatimonadota bacterium]
MNVTILGLGLFSGGVAAARFFSERGDRVTVTDLRDADSLRSSLDELQDVPVRFVLERHREEDILGADLVVVTPAIKEDNAYLQLARDHNIRITTEINLVFEHCPAPIIGITGSNGKTTTTSLLGVILQAHDPRAVVGGNIGKSILNELDAIPEDAIVALELSSFQLKRLSWIGRSPHISIVTNLTPNHLDWHGSFEDYAASKEQILLSQSRDDIAILNADDPLLRYRAQTCNGKVLLFSLEKTVSEGAFLQGSEIIFRQKGHERVICGMNDLRIPGPHNLANALAAITAACVYGVPSAVIQRAVMAFQGVPHRVEYVTERDGIRYYNDSACTTPESTITALQAFDAPIILIAGGYDKGVDFGRMADEIVRNARTAVLIGKTAQAIEQAILTRRTGFIPDIVRCATMAAAVAQSQAIADFGDVVILSPGCASYDMFKNYEDRGNRFKELVR